MDWPSNLKAGVIRQWPGTLTTRRALSPFRRPGGSRTPLTTTVDDLRRELTALNAKNAVLLMALQPRDIRNDGLPRADARPEHPGIILTFETKQGTLSYPCDTYTDWESNLRAVALSLEALRAVDRHGVTKHGEQYRGFLELESGIAVGTGVNTVTRALEVISEHGENVTEKSSPADLARAINRALRDVHPDAHLEDDSGYDWAAAFQRVQAAKKLLGEKGYLS